MIVALLLACSRHDSDSEAVEEVHPRMYVSPEQRAGILERIDQEPWATMYARIQANAAAEWRDDGDEWTAGVHGDNGRKAHAAAFLAWLHDDPAMADVALEGFERLETDFETNTDWDVNIGMVHPLMGYADALDLMLGTPWLPDAERAEAERKLGEVTGKFYAAYVDDEAIRRIVLGPAQNNHPIRTASAIGYAALMLPDHPDSGRWLDFAASEVDYLMGPDGKYVQPDGSVSEGPFYYGFAFAAVVPFSIAMRNVGVDRELHRDCRNRQDVPPWTGHGCVEDEPFTFRNPIDDGALFATADWWTAIRLPSGASPPLEDAYFNGLNGGAVLTGFEPNGRWVWSWQDNQFTPLESGWGADTSALHLTHVDPAAVPVEPDWTTRFFLDGGHAVLRSDWSRDARYLLLTAEAGAARMTLHDHVDGTSFQVAAYGEYLLVDPGYYKPTELDNAVTSGSESHNLIRIDGRGAPAKGWLTDFGDTDAWLLHPHDGERLDWIEATQTYQDTTIVRAIGMVRDRWFFVADRLETGRTDARPHQWRLGGNAGYDAGGVFTLGAGTARWERALAGIDLHLASTAPGLALIEPAVVEGDAPHVHEFDERRNVGEHAVVDGVVTGVEPGFLAVLAPYRVGGSGDDAPLAVAREDVGPGAVAFRVGSDVVALRDPDGPTRIDVAGHTIETDARVVLVGLDGDLAAFSAGTFVRLDGTEVAAGAEVAVVE